MPSAGTANASGPFARQKHALKSAGLEVRGASAGLREGSSHAAREAMPITE